MKKLLIFSLIFFLYGCTQNFRIDDRIPYESELRIKNDISKKKNIKLCFDKEFENLKITKKPSGSADALGSFVFEIGKTIKFYVLQIKDLAFVESCPDPSKITMKIKVDQTKQPYKLSLKDVATKESCQSPPKVVVKIREYNIDFTLASPLLIFPSYNPSIDYFKMDVTFDVSYEKGKTKNNKTYTYSNERRLTKEDIRVERDFLVRQVMANIAESLIKDIYIEVSSLP